MCVCVCWGGEGGGVEGGDWQMIFIRPYEASYPFGGIFYLSNNFFSHPI